MAERKITKPGTPKVKPAKAKAKAKPTTTVKVAKPKAASKPARKVAPNKQAPVRTPRQADASLPGFEDFRQKQADLEVAAKQAKAAIRKAHDIKMKEADALKKQYFDLFNESFDTVSKPRKASRKGPKSKRATRGQAAPYKTAEIETFIEQKKKGLTVKDIKIKGRRPKSIQRISAAYDKASSKDTASILALLKS
jgi:hypothetical protein